LPGADYRSTAKPKGKKHHNGKLPPESWSDITFEKNAGIITGVADGRRKIVIAANPGKKS